MNTYWEHLQSLLTSGRPFVSVTLVDIIASAPQNVGAKMLVTSDGLFHGTVGGGKIENKAIAEARTLLAETAADRPNRFVEWNLQRDVGMTCGGAVRLYFEVYNAADWPIVIFGAGHCSQALTRLLLTLNCQLTVIDHRPEWLNKLPPQDPPAGSPKYKTILADQPLPTYVHALPKNAFVLLMTMGHSSDQPILIEILQTRTAAGLPDFPYLGVIGSDAKAAALKRGLLAANLPESSTTRYHCPIGLPLGTNAPAEIAISIAGQLLEKRDSKTPQPNKSN